MGRRMVVLPRDVRAVGSVLVRLIMSRVHVAGSVTMVGMSEASARSSSVLFMSRSTSALLLLRCIAMVVRGVETWV
jgi:hypothetical protein